MTTGSLGKKYDVNRIQKIVNDLAGEIDPENGPPAPIYEIKGNGYIWCFSPSKKTMVRIPRGGKIYILDSEPDENNRLLIFSPYEVVYVNANDVRKVGYN
tara:strand:- start:187 stop:486 length:300 start_codon:yes stop_codon:yes gene_type:complete